jgi:hypothetical protein
VQSYKQEEVLSEGDDLFFESPIKLNFLLQQVDSPFCKFLEKKEKGTFIIH